MTVLVCIALGIGYLLTGAFLAKSTLNEFKNPKTWDELNIWQKAKRTILFPILSFSKDRAWATYTYGENPSSILKIVLDYQAYKTDGARVNFHDLVPEVEQVYFSLSIFLWFLKLPSLAFGIVKIVIYIIISIVTKFAQLLNKMSGAILATEKTEKIGLLENAQQELNAHKSKMQDLQNKIALQIKAIRKNITEWQGILEEINSRKGLEVEVNTEKYYTQLEILENVAKNKEKEFAQGEKAIAELDLKESTLALLADLDSQRKKTEQLGIDLDFSTTDKQIQETLLATEAIIKICNGLYKREREFLRDHDSPVDDLAVSAVEGDDQAEQLSTIKTFPGARCMPVLKN